MDLLNLVISALGLGMAVFWPIRAEMRRQRRIREFHKLLAIGGFAASVLTIVCQMHRK